MSGKDAGAVAADFDVTMDVVTRIAVIAGLKVPLQGLYEPDVYYKPCPDLSLVISLVPDLRQISSDSTRLRPLLQPGVEDRGAMCVSGGRSADIAANDDLSHWVQKV